MEPIAIEDEYPWEKEWEEEKICTFPPLVFDDDDASGEETGDDTKEESPVSQPHRNLTSEDSKTQHDDVKNSSGISTEPRKINTPSDTEKKEATNRCEPKSSSVEVSSAKNDSNVNELSFTERYRKTQKIQEDLYDKLFATTSQVSDVPQVKQEGAVVVESTLSKTAVDQHPCLDNEKAAAKEEEEWDEEEAALQIMEESEPEPETVADIDNAKEGEEPCASPDLSPERSFSRRDSIVYRRSSSCDSNDSCGSASPELCVVTNSSSTTKSSTVAKDFNATASNKCDKEALPDNPKQHSSLDARFNFLCKENGVDTTATDKKKEDRGDSG